MITVPDSTQQPVEPSWVASYDNGFCRQLSDWAYRDKVRVVQQWDKFDAGESVSGPA